MAKNDRDLKYETYIDLPLKEFIVKHGVELFGFEVMINPYSEKDVDLVAVHDHSILIECERSGAVYSFWDDPEGYQYKMGYDYKHVNFEDRRKGPYFEPKRPKYIGNPVSETNPLLDNPGYDKSFFVRTSFHFHQIIIIPSEVIRDKSKSVTKWKKVNNNHNDKEEFWRSWKKDDTITFNLIDGMCVRETDDPLTHLPPITDEEFKILKDEKYRIKREAREQQEKENVKRASSLYKQSKTSK